MIKMLTLKAVVVSMLNRTEISLGDNAFFVMRQPSHVDRT